MMCNWCCEPGWPLADGGYMMPDGKMVRRDVMDKWSEMYFDLITQGLSESNATSAVKAERAKVMKNGLTAREALAWLKERYGPDIEN